MHNTKKNTVVIIAGATAIGKTAMAIQVAKHFNTQIISADSRQCYKELGIAVAKPTNNELSAVHHYFINSHSIHQNVNAGHFEQYALQAANEIFKNNNIAVMVGGTGLYIKSFCQGLDDMPTINENIRQEILNNYKAKGLQWLQTQVETKDNTFWQIAEQQNPQRLMRALEILNATGKSIMHFRQQNVQQRPFNIIKIALQLPKEILHERINNRVDAMVQNGLLQEAEELFALQHLNALQTVGYKELFNYFNGICNLPQAIEQIKINTRQYAKRQNTWFKKDDSFVWQSATNTNQVIQYLQTIIQ